MDLIVASEYNDLSRKAVDFVAATVAAKPGCNVVLPTGNTPMGLELAQAYGSLFPAVNEALEKPAFQGGQMDVFTEILKNSAPLPQVSQEGEFETFVGKAVSNLIQKAATTGSVTESDIKAELEAAQQRIKAGGGG